MRPNTSSSGIFSTKRSSPVSMSRLTRMLVPKPKNAFQSPGTQSFGLLVLGQRRCRRDVITPLLRFAISTGLQIAAITSGLVPTQPKMPPWALIIFSPISWNSGK